MRRRIAIGFLAGGTGGRLQPGIPKDKRVPKAFMRLAGKTMLEHLIDEARKLSPDKIFVVHPKGWAHAVPSLDRVVTIEGGIGYIPDLFNLISKAGDVDLLLIINADAVLVDAGAMCDLLKVAIETGAGFVWPGVPEEVCIPEESVRYIPGQKWLRRPNVLAVRPREIVWGPKLQRMLRCMQSRTLSHIGEGIIAANVLGLRRARRCVSQTFPWGEFWDIAGRVFFRSQKFPGLTAGEFFRRWWHFNLPADTLADYIGQYLGCQAAIPAVSRKEFVFDIDYEVDLLRAIQELWPELALQVGSAADGRQPIFY